jgi:predicted aldo/keto reductase-like oxidoreductase
METRLNRRVFLSGAAAGMAAPWALGSRSGAAPGPAAPGLPKRILGRTAYSTTILGLGMAPIGMGEVTLEEAERLVNEALDLGINYVDVAPNYANAEEKLGPVMQKRRKDVFLVTKVESQQKPGILAQIQNSLRLMRTDHLDAVHLHNLGDFNLEEVFHSENGGMAALREAKQRGYLRFFGISGHMRPWKFAGAIATGQVDLVMCAMNFVDRHVYNFEDTILAAAQKQKTAVVAMKVLGGANGMVYQRPTPARLAGHYEDAIRYALGLPGVSAVILGLRDSAEIRRAVATAQRYRPMNQAQLTALLERGRQMAATWGEHFGPVV